MSEEVRSFSILIVDDEPVNIQVAAGYLKNEGIKISFATSGAEALQRLEAMDFDLFILDIMMPGMDGYELCRHIKGLPRYKDVPVIFLTAKIDKDSLVEGFSNGAADYITKPFFAQELIHRVNAHLKIRDLQRKMEDYTNQLNLQILKSMKIEEELREHQEALTRANMTLLEWASKDPLTDLFNRRRAQELMDYEADRCKRHNRPMGVLLLDLDKFKTVNDTFGHEAGDQVLVTASHILKKTLRRQDILARWGGEEFLVVLPETPAEGTRIVAEKIRRGFAESSSILPGSQVTVSVGAGLKLPEDSWEETLEKIDQELYKAKKQGRNRVCGLES